MYWPDHYNVNPPEYYMEEPPEIVHYPALDGMALCLYADTESPIIRDISQVNCYLCLEIYYG